MEQELPLTSIKIKDILKDSKLTNFERLILALIKFYPEPKKQRELCLEAGINDSELSAWKHGRRGKGYEQFFKKYIEADAITHGLKLKVHEDVFSKLIEIAKKGERAKEIISKSIYFKELVSKDLRLLIIALNEKVLDLGRAKDIFLKMLEANGVTKDEIIEKLNNISEEALSCYTKLYLNFLLNKFRIFGDSLFENLNLDRIIKDIKRGKPSFDTSFLNLGWVLAVNLMEVFSRSWRILDEPMFPVPLTDKPYLYHCSDKELDELFSWLAKKEKYHLGTLPADLFDNYLLEKAGKPLRVRKWVKIGCMTLLLEFDLRKMITSNSISVNNSVSVNITSYTTDLQCPIDKSECNLDVFERFKCPKLKELLKEVIRNETSR